MTTLHEYKTEINKGLDKLAIKAKFGHKNGVEVDSNEVYRNLLNIQYNWNLELLPFSKQFNLQLGDKKRKIAVQLSTENSPGAIKKIIQQFVKYGLYNTYSNLFIFMVSGKDQYPFVRFDKETKRRFTFNADEHIIDNDAIHDFVRKANLDKTTALYQCLIENKLIEPANNTAHNDTNKSTEKHDTTNNKATDTPSEFNNETPIKYIKAAKEVTPNDVMGFRAKHFMPLYWKRPLVDGVMNDLILEGKNIMLVGNVLAGKTRAVYEMIKELDNTEVIQLNPKYINEKTLIPTPSSTTKQIVVLDELDNYYKYHDKDKKRVDTFLQNLVGKNRVLVATCRRGVEHQTLNAYLPDNILHSFNLVSIEAMHDRDIDAFQNESEVKLDFDAFNHNIGSLLLQLSQKKRWCHQTFNFDKYHDKRERKIAELAETILIALKTMYLGTNFEGHSQCYAVSKVKDFCQRHGGRMIKQSLWDEAIKLLSEQGEMITTQNDNLITDVVLLEQVVLPHYRYFKIERLLNEVYTTQEERKEKNYFVNVYDYTKRLLFAKNFDDAEYELAQMQKIGLTPNEATYAVIIDKCPHYQIALSFVEEMQKQNITISPAVFKNLLHKTNSRQQALELLQMMQHKGIKIDALVYTKLIEKAANFHQAESLLLQMKNDGLTVNENIVRQVLNKADTYEQALHVLDTMQKEGFNTTTDDYNELLKKTNQYDEATNVLVTMKNNGVELNAATFDNLFDKIHGFEQAEELIKKMKKNGLKPNKMVFDALIRTAQTYEQAIKTIEGKKKYGYEPTIANYNDLIVRVESFGKAMNLLESMETYRLTPNVGSFNALMQKAPTFEQSTMVYNYMQAEGIHPNATTFTSLIYKCDDFEQTKTFIQQMLLANLVPKIEVYTNLIDKAPNFKEALGLLQKMKTQGLKPDNNLMATFQRKLKKQEQGFVNHMLKLYPQTLRDADFHQIYVRCLYNIDVKDFLNRAEQYITENDAWITLYVEWLIKIRMFSHAANLLEKMNDKGKQYHHLLQKLL